MEKDYILLDKSKEILNDFRDNYRSRIRGIVKELRPGNYYFGGISQKDEEFIYYTIGSLDAELNSTLFDFDVKGHYITAAKAIENLQSEIEIIKKDLLKLQDLQKKYESVNNAPKYPIDITINYHKKVLDVLNVVMNLEEVQNVLRPNYAEQLETENLTLKFELYWKKHFWKYIFQLFFFFLALLFFSAILAFRSKYWLAGIFSGLIPFGFSFFTNTNIQDSFSFIFSKNLKDKKFQEFKQKNNR